MEQYTILHIIYKLILLLLFGLFLFSCTDEKNKYSEQTKIGYNNGIFGSHTIIVDDEFLEVRDNRVEYVISWSKKSTN